MRARADMGRALTQWIAIAGALTLGLIELLALQRCRYQTWRSKRPQH
jgi:hypothetical protein